MNLISGYAIIERATSSTTLLDSCKTRVCGHKVTKTRLAKGTMSPLNPWRGYTTMSENKTKLVKVRMTEKEFDQLKYFSEITNQNMSEFVRNLIENRPPKIIEELLKVKENLENSRMNLLREISETKVILSEILKELR